MAYTMDEFAKLNLALDGKSTKVDPASTLVQIPDVCWPICKKCKARVKAVRVQVDSSSPELRTITVECHGDIMFRNIPELTFRKALGDKETAQEILDTIASLVPGVLEPTRPVIRKAADWNF